MEYWSTGVLEYWVIRNIVMLSDSPAVRHAIT